MAEKFYRGLESPEMQEELCCPACSQCALRYAGYDFTTLYFECRACAAQYTIEQQFLKKAILYLDQWALSLMHKGADGRPDLAIWRSILKRLSNLARNQVLVCPHSAYHLVDSQLDSRLADDLELLFRHLAHGASFRHHQTLEACQLQRVFTAFMDGRSISMADFPQTDAFEGDPDEPGEDIDIYTPIKLEPDEISETRSKRDNGYARWVDICSDTTPDDLNDLEALARRHSHGYGRLVMQTYLDYVQRRARMEAGQETFDIDYILAQTNRQEYRFADIAIERLMRVGGKHEDAVIQAMKLFSSDHFAEMPSLKIGSLLLAAVERKTASGRKPIKTDAADINMIRHYAPYCDAMLVDNEFRAMATEAPIKIDERYRCLFFSARTKEDFIEWLDACETLLLDKLEERPERGAIPDERIGAKTMAKFGKVVRFRNAKGSEKAEDGCSND